jgi:hypothetical protein
MGGGLLQLVAYGAQDIYLTGNPQITFFKVVYRRHTNFALESIENVFNGNPRFGSRVTCQISRNGDLIHRTYLAAMLPSLAGSNKQWVRSVGLRMIADVWIEIGGQQIDKHYSDWMYIWNELSLPVGKKSGYDAMVGNAFSASATVPGASLAANSGATWVHVPLEFWFCRNVGLALPLIALQYHEVKINIDFETFANCTVSGDAVSGVDLSNVSLWVDYIYLDTDERRRFAQLSHEYLIEQLQFTGDERVTSNGRIKMNFNHPVKELVWVYAMDSNSVASGVSGSSNHWTNYTLGNAVTGTAGPDSDPMVHGNIQLNGQDRFFDRHADYFTLVQPYQHHENIPTQTPGIHVYSFALKPEEHQPSGSLNFSRIDTAYLNVALASSVTANNAARCKIFAVNYNVLRIMSGMGGLAYSN